MRKTDPNNSIYPEPEFNYAMQSLKTVLESNVHKDHKIANQTVMTESYCTSSSVTLATTMSSKGLLTDPSLLA